MLLFVLCIGDPRFSCRVAFVRGVCNVWNHTTRVFGCYVMPLGNLAVVPERHLDLAYQVLRSGAVALVIPGIQTLGVMLIVLECTER